MRFGHGSQRTILKSIVVLATLLSPSLLLAAPPEGKGGGGGKNKASLSVAVSPAKFTERDAGALGTVTRENSDTSVALIVNLDSSDTTEATVADSVEILAGEVSAEFLVLAEDDAETDGDQQVTISVSATDHSGASTTITVVDDEGLPSIEYQRVAIALPFPDGTSAIFNDFNDSAKACGTYEDLTGDRFGWLYDPELVANAVDANTLDIDGLDSGWVIRSCVGISNNGLVVGRISPAADSSYEGSRGYILDTSVIPALLFELPDNGYGWQSTYARKVNDNGDILGTFTRTDGSAGAYLFNLGLRTGAPDAELEILDFLDAGGAACVLNNPPEGTQTTIAARTNSNEIAVYKRGGLPYLLPPEVNADPALNDFEGVAARGSVEEQISKRKSEVKHFIYRDYVGEEYIDGFFGNLENLNNSGTMMIRNVSDLILYHDSYGFIDVSSITAQGQFPSSTGYAVMNNFSDDGFGQIAIKEGYSSTAEFYILTPVELAP